MSVRVPTEPQYRLLLTLGNGCMVISGLSGRPMRQCLHHGWIAPEKKLGDNGFRITPDGLRALTAAVERYGLPDLTQRAVRPEPPLVQRLRQDRDDARAARDLAQRDARSRGVAIARARRVLEDATQ